MTNDPFLKINQSRLIFISFLKSVKGKNGMEDIKNMEAKKNQPESLKEKPENRIQKSDQAILDQDVLSGKPLPEGNQITVQFLDDWHKQQSEKNPCWDSLKYDIKLIYYRQKTDPSPSPEPEPEKEESVEDLGKRILEDREKKKWLDEDFSRMPKGVTQFFCEPKNHVDLKHNLFPTDLSISNCLFKKQKTGGIEKTEKYIEIFITPGELLKFNKDEKRESNFSGNEYNLLYSHIDEMQRIGLIEQAITHRGVGNNVRDITLRLPKDIWYQTYLDSKEKKPVEKMLFCKVPTPGYLRNNLKKAKGKKTFSKMFSYSVSKVSKIRLDNLNGKDPYVNSPFKKKWKRDLKPVLINNSKYFLDDLKKSLQICREMFFPKAKIKTLFHRTITDKVIGFQFDAIPDSG